MYGKIERFVEQNDVTADARILKLRVNRDVFNEIIVVVFSYRY